MRRRRPSSPIQLKPHAIAELLRTRVLPPSLLLRVELIVVDKVSCRRDEDTISCASPESPSDEVPSHTTRLLLTDGHLNVQAVLHGDLHPLIAGKELGKGSLVELRKYKVTKADRLNGQGQVVYFAIEDLDVVRASTATTTSPENTPAAALPGGFLREEAEASISPPSKRQKLEGGFVVSGPQTEAITEDMHSTPSSQESDTFEVASVDHEVVQQRRRALHDLSSNSLKLGSENGSQVGGVPHKRKRLTNNALTSTRHPLNQHHPTHSHPNASVTNSTHAISTPPQPPPSHDTSQSNPPSAAPPLHTLHSLLHPPTPLPPRKYTCTVFALISWISRSLIHKPHSPFPPKRHLKIHDPSISSRHTGITVAVFIDAKDFIPKLGTIALFRGLTMQRWEGEVILNAYASLRDGKERWYVDDDDVLRGWGYDVDGMRGWWEERSRRGGKREEHPRLERS